MTATQEASIDRRTAYIADLRALADFLERTPELPAPSLDIHALIHVQPAEFAATASALGGQRSKEADENYIGVLRMIGGAKVEVYTSRSEVCERKVVGTEKVMVPDPNAPLVEVEREIVEWKCAPLLATTEAA